MDIVLEVFDYCLFDYAYAKLLPAQAPLASEHGVRAAIHKAASALQETTAPYRPASQFLQLGTSPFTYASQLPRDNTYRQAFSLCLITS